MIDKIRNIIRSQIELTSLNGMRKEINQLNINNGKVLSELNLLKRESILRDIQKAEFQVFSQWGDDGIINFLVNYLDIEQKRFVEFGVENYIECNTRFLLVNNNWEGLIMDGSKENMEAVKRSDIYWRHNLKAVDAFITAENINDLLLTNNFTGEIGLLHIDIDGNDYWVWKNVTVVNPVIIIVEYNSVFGIENPWSVPYDPAFVRSNAHYSNLYYGSSLLSLCHLAEEKGYHFIGCNSNGNNAYFVRKDKIKDIKVRTPQDGFVVSQFSESRDKEGNLTFKRGNERLETLRGLPIFNTMTGKLETI